MEKKKPMLEENESGGWRSCVHCGLCLDSCPTYRITGNENQSPRGRLAVLRALKEGRIPSDSKAAEYLDGCIECLACASACPSNVSCGAEVGHFRSMRKIQPRGAGHRLISLAGWLIRRPVWFKTVFFFLRVFRWAGMVRFWQVQGKPPVFSSTRRYAARLKRRFGPKGGKIALFTGCIVEEIFREINFACVRVLTVNHFQVDVPSHQCCCGAILEHNGLPGKPALEQRNRRVFDGGQGLRVITNSAGCGLSLRKTLNVPVDDIVPFLNEQPLVIGAPLVNSKVFLDIPCHLYHGMKERALPAALLAAAGVSNWGLLPDFEQCCGSGGTYQFTHPGNADAIIRKRCELLKELLPDGNAVIAASNPVCMMQWQAAVSRGYPGKRVRVVHLVQLLDESYLAGGLYPKGV